MHQIIEKSAHGNLKYWPWQRIALISCPITSKPSSPSNKIPDEFTTNGNITGGEIGDFATFINLWPAIEFYKS